jgi:hypothetical protein
MLNKIQKKNLRNNLNIFYIIYYLPSMFYNKNKVKLSIDTNLDDLEENNTNNSHNSHNSNQLRFKTYVNGIVEIQNIQDCIIRLSIITSLFILACPRFFVELHFLNEATNDIDANTVEIIYLKISILENILLSAFTYYFIIREDLDDIYAIKYGINSMPNLIFIGKIEKFWYKYYSWLGITISANYYYNNTYITHAYMYILWLSIFRLGLLQYFEKIKIINF